MPITDLVWFDNSSATCTTTTATCAVTRRVYDLTTGNVIERWKPMQSLASSTQAKYDYDTRKLFVSAEHSEAGGYNITRNDLTYVYEYGTGTKLETKGPNIAFCAGRRTPRRPAQPARRTSRTAGSESMVQAA